MWWTTERKRTFTPAISGRKQLMSSLEKFNRGQKRIKIVWRIFFVIIGIFVIYVLASYCSSASNGQYGPDADNDRLIDANGGKACQTGRPLLAIEVKAPDQVETPDRQEGSIKCPELGKGHYIAMLYTQHDTRNPNNDQTWEDVRDIDPKGFSLNYRPHQKFDQNGNFVSNDEQYVQIWTVDDDTYREIKASGWRIEPEIIRNGNSKQITNMCEGSFLTRVGSEKPCTE